MKRIIQNIQRYLTPDLLNSKWRELVQPGDHPVTGHCYIAAEVLYHAWGKKRGYKPVVLSLGDGQTHWFLRHPSTGAIADPSPEQFDGEPIAYDKGKWCGFLTRQPSKRCRVVLRRMGAL